MWSHPYWLVNRLTISLSFCSTSGYLSDLSHADLKADNLLIGFEDDKVIEDYVEQQRIDPPLSVFRNAVSASPDQTLAHLEEGLES